MPASASDVSGAAAAAATTTTTTDSLLATGIRPLEPYKFVVLECQPFDAHPAIRQRTNADGFAQCFYKLFESVKEKIQWTCIYAHLPSALPATALTVQHLIDNPDAIREYDAFLITGSFNGAYQTIPWIVQLCDLINMIHDAKVPLLGVCFGHQIIAHAIGGLAKKNPNGLELGIHAARLIKDNYDKFIRENEMDSEWLQRTELLLPYIHNDVAYELPKHAIALACNDMTAYQMYYIPRLAFCVQGHPEFAADPEMYQTLIDLHDDFDKVVVEEAKMTIRERRPDHALIAEMMVEFVVKAKKSKISAA